MEQMDSSGETCLNMGREYPRRWRDDREDITFQIELLFLESQLMIIFT